MPSTIAVPALPISVPYQPARISVERYHELIRLGTFRENERLELLEGVVVEKMTKHPAHVLAVSECLARISQMLPAGWYARGQDPITLARSEPEPDVAVVRGQRADYARRHPIAGEIELVVEAADSTLVTDRYKADIYAAANIPHYWILNLAERVVEVYSGPNLAAGPHYGPPRIFHPADEVPLVIEGRQVGTLRAADLLP